MSKRLTTEEFIKKAEDKHGKGKYDYSKVDCNIKGDKVTILCKIHLEFVQTKHNHLQGKGCAICSGVKKKTTSEFIEQAKFVHGNKYNYSKVNYRGNKFKVKLICSIHGDFEQEAKAHVVLKQGCPKCAGNQQKTSAQFIKAAKLVHEDKYLYDKVNYIGAKHKVKLTCKHHGEFKQEAGAHLQGAGCLICSGNYQKTTTDFINEAVVLQGNKYNYSKVNYNHIMSEVIITCDKHGDFKQKARDHLRNRGCQKCNLSHGETRILNYLTIKNIIYIPQKTFDGCTYIRKLSFDFYLPEYNLCIEFDGKQHYEPIKIFGGLSNFKLTKRRDNLKTKFCKNNIINLLRISYKDINDIESILKDYLKL